MTDAKDAASPGEGTSSPSGEAAEKRRPSRARRALAVGCAATLSLCVCTGVGRFCLAPGAYSPPPLRRGDGVRILTWNVGTMDPRAIRMPGDVAGRVAEVIVDADVDLVVLQEVASDAQAASIWRAVDRVDSESWRYDVWMPDESDPGGLGVILTQIRSVVRDKPTKGPRGLASVHLSLELQLHSVHAHPRSAVARAELFQSACDITRASNSVWRRPVVIAGDFNLDPEGRAFANLIPGADADLDRETFATLVEQFPVGTGPTPTTAYGLRFDHIRASQGAIVTEHVIRGARRYPQDHDPLLVELCLHVEAGEPPCARCRGD